MGSSADRWSSQWRRSSRPSRRWDSMWWNIDRGAADSRAAIRGTGTGAARVRRHPRRPARQRRGADRARSCASPTFALRAVPLWLLPAVNPDGVARGQKNSARDVDLESQFPGAFVHDGDTPPATSPRRGRCPSPRRAYRRPHRPRRSLRGGGPRAVRLRQFRRPGRGLGRGRGRRVRLAGARGHWLPHPRLSRELARHRPRPPRLTLELPPGPLSRFRGPAAAALDESIRAAPL